MKLNKNCNGFSLIELSISVIIIAIIIAGITTGAALQKQAQIRAISNEINLIQTAINSFKLQYNYLPGDIPNATKIWSSTSPITVNGNGNNKIGWDGYSDNNSSSEDTYIFQHLYLAGFVDISFSGGIQSPNRYLYSVNAYPSKYNNAMYSVIYQSYYPGVSISNSLEYGNINSDSCDGHNNGGVLNASEAYQLDLKIDDGAPTTGRILTTRSCGKLSANTCVNSPYYLNSDLAINCIIAWILD